jgi:hypothetical protein
MVPLKEAVKILNNNGFPIGYHTLYQWARYGVLVNQKKFHFATQVGNRWMVDETKLEYLMERAKQYERIRLKTPGKEKGSDRGHSTGKKINRPHRKRNSATADRL